MQQFKILGLCICVMAGLAPATAHAAKGDGPKARFFAKYDANKNGVIDGTEKDAVRKDYAADKEGDLKRFDTNQDGQLSDEELAAIKPPAGKKKPDATGKSAGSEGRSSDTSGGSSATEPSKPESEKPGGTPGASSSKTP